MQKDYSWGTIQRFHHIGSCGKVGISAEHSPMRSDIIRSGGGLVLFPSSSHHHLLGYSKHTNTGCRFSPSSHWLLCGCPECVCGCFTAGLCPEREPFRVLFVCVWAACQKLKAAQEYPRLSYVSGFPVSARVPGRDMQKKTQCAHVCVLAVCVHILYFV